MVKSTKPSASVSPRPETSADSDKWLQQRLNKLSQLRQNLVEQINQLRSGSATNVRQPRASKKEIARSLTEINQKAARAGRSGSALKLRSVAMPRKKKPATKKPAAKKTPTARRVSKPVKR